jgi:putative ABC transport system permease protein
VALEVRGRRTSVVVVGRARETFSPASAYLPKGFVDGLLGQEDLTNSLRLAFATQDAVAREAVRAVLDERLRGEGIRLAGSSTKGEGRYAFDQHMLMIYVFLLLVAGVLALVGGLGQATTASLGVLERRRELGVFRALGATPRTVVLLLAAEGVVVAGLGALVATAVAIPVSAGLGSLMGALMFREAFDLRFATGGALAWLAFSLVLGAVASALPALEASRRPVREAISYE